MSLLPEQRTGLRKLLDYLKGKKVGSPEIIAFFEIERSISLRIRSMEHPHLSRPEEISQQDHDIHRNRYTMPGYDEAYRVIIKLFEDMGLGSSLLITNPKNVQERVRQTTIVSNLLDMQTAFFEGKLAEYVISDIPDLPKEIQQNNDDLGKDIGLF